ncbi:MAG: tetratricopeptide repeat protein [Sandaracinaceae bacterium]
MVHLGHTLRLLGRYDQALRMGQQVLARDKHDADALYLMALTHYAVGDEAAAKAYLERFLATNPEVEVAQEATGLLGDPRRRVPLEETATSTQLQRVGTATRLHSSTGAAYRPRVHPGGPPSMLSVSSRSR